MEECGICFYEYGPGREAQALDGCVHVICASCLLQMVGKDSTVTCPFCRALCALPSDLLYGQRGGTDKVRSRRSWVKKLLQPTKRHQGNESHRLKPETR
ncbi:E3 ubiquitin-protein ligase RNF152 isoform X2 [Xenopus laevis]|uniref:E3 ubiquitin-protein ligase RNF152 isoform X2 n=1 Tax=Xenopus laevis TaxID=8355 RepID=A0A8J0UTR8_XENLA|nr:E3 ubiquitin-protein ligase RNF152 isoform X2 [Xenopus laevis]